MVEISRKGNCLENVLRFQEKENCLENVLKILVEACQLWHTFYLTLVLEKI